MHSTWLALTLALLLPLSATASTQWGALRPGEHAVGYRTLQVRDVERSYFDEPRHLQIYVWYPAARNSTPYMNYGRYLEDAAFDWGENPARVEYLGRRTRAEFKSGAMNPSFPGEIPADAFAAILATPTRAVRDAPSAPGRFPVLLHAHMQGALHQSVLLEYLASHGFVVLSVSTYNSAPAFYGRPTPPGVRYASYLRVSRDGRSILYVQFDQWHSDIELLPGIR